MHDVRTETVSFKEFRERERKKGIFKDIYKYSNIGKPLIHPHFISNFIQNNLIVIRRVGRYLRGNQNT